MGVRLVLRSALSKAAPANVTYDFDQERIVVGRGTGADVRIPHRCVSELHATLQLQAGHYTLTDHGSTNGSFVGGQRLVPHRPKVLENGSDITCGGFVLRFQAGIANTTTTSTERTASLARRLLREVLEPDASSNAAPYLQVIRGPDADNRFSIPAPPSSIIVGRDEHCGWILQDSDISREHLELVRDMDGVLAKDMGSKNGVHCSGRPIKERRLRQGDELRLGATVLRFEDPAERALQAMIGEPDLETPQTHTLPQVAVHHVRDELVATDASSVAGAADAATQRTPMQSRRSPSLGADAIIYLLAAVVLGLSLTGLVILLQAS